MWRLQRNVGELRAPAGTISKRQVVGPRVEIRIELSGVKLGVLAAEEARVSLVELPLAEETESVCRRIRSALTAEEVAQLASVRAVRAMFRSWGLDPARYRPSSEALLRRVAQGKGLYRVSNVVDACNLGSIEAGWPYGCYDRNEILPPVTFRLGRAGEAYAGIGKTAWHLEGRPVLADREGPFGSPISDSMRTRITASTKSVWVVIYAPAEAPDTELEQALGRCADRLARFARARVEGTVVCT